MTVQTSRPNDGTLPLFALLGGMGIALAAWAPFVAAAHLAGRTVPMNPWELIFGLADTNKRIVFFPINWREDDQVSNAKLFTQGITMLKMLWHRFSDKDDFLRAEHRQIAREAYPATIIRRWGKGGDTA